MIWILFLVSVTTNGITSTTVEFGTEQSCQAAKAAIEKSQSGFRYDTYGTCVESDRYSAVRSK